MTVGLGSVEGVGDFGKASFTADQNWFKREWEEGVDSSGVRHRLQGSAEEPSENGRSMGLRSGEKILGEHIF